MSVTKIVGHGDLVCLFMVVHEEALRPKEELQVRAKKYECHKDEEMTE